MPTPAELTRASLPPLPPDPENTGRRMGWVVVAAEPLLVWYDDQGKRFEQAITPEWIDDQVVQFRALTQGGAVRYYPPMGVEHHRDGGRIGDLVEAAAFTDRGDGRRKLAVAVRYNASIGPSIEEGIASGAIRYASPTFAGICLDDGREFAWVMIECSIVTAPHMKTTAEQHVFGQRTEHKAMDPTTTTDPMAGLTKLVTDLTGKIDAIGQRLAVVESRLAADTAEDVAEGATPPPMNESKADPKLTQLEQELAATKAALAEQQFAGHFRAHIEGKAIKLEGSDIGQAIFALRQVAPAQTDKLLSFAQAADAKSVPATPPVAPSPWSQGPILPAASFSEPIGAGAKTREEKLQAAKARAEKEAAGDFKREIELYKQYSAAI